MVHLDYIPDISWTDNSLTEYSPTDNYSPTGQFPDQTIPQPDNFLTGQFLTRQFSSWTTFSYWTICNPENCMLPDQIMPQPIIVWSN